MIKLRIEELAKQKEITQSKLQRESGVTMPTLRRYWSNNTESVHLESLERIARALEVDVRDLFEPTMTPIQYAEPNYRCLAPGCQERVTSSSGTDGYCPRHAHLAERE